MAYDFDELNNRLFSAIDYYVRSWLPEGRQERRHWVAINKTRADSHLGSFKVDMQSGSWKDYATQDTGTDLISLYAYLFCNNQQGEAYKILKSESGIQIPVASISSVKAQSKKKNFNTTFDNLVEQGKTICLPVPEDAPPYLGAYKIDEEYISLVDENKKPITNSKQLKTYFYRNENGELMFIEYRFQFTDRPKEIRYATCWRNNSTQKTSWEKCNLKDNRPIYNLENLTKYPHKTVLVTEGAKCVEAVKWQFNKFFSDIAEWPFIPISWCGGVNGIGRTNFEPLKNRQIIYWPDNDEPGKDAMRSLSLDYIGIVMDIDEGLYEKGWDVADLIRDGGSAISFVNEKITPKTDVNVIPRVPLERFPDIDEKFRLLGTIENLEAMLKFYKYEIFFNVISLDFDCRIESKIFKEQGYLGSFHSRVVSRCKKNKLPITEGVLNGYLDEISMRYKKNPPLYWVNAKRWDGVNRVNKIIDAVIPTSGFNEYLKTALIKKWLISAYAALVREDGDDFRTRGVLVFQGKQESGKSTFFRNLMGGNLDWFYNGVTLNAEIKDSLIEANSFWIVELGEIENTTKRNLSALKAYLTNNKTVIRMPYARKKETIWRRTVYCGDVNQDEFLYDQTGNTRFWSIPVEKLLDISDIDMQQMWAEVRYLYEKAIINKEKYIWWLSPVEVELLNESNSDFEIRDSIEDLIGSKLDWGSDYLVPKTPTDILFDCGIREPSTAQLKKAGFILRKLLKLDKAPPKDAFGVRYYNVPTLKSGQPQYVGWGYYND